MFYSLTERLIASLLKACLPKRSISPVSLDASTLARGDLVLGNAVKTGRPIVLALNERKRHLWLCGSTGGGKTNTILRLIDADIDANKTVVVIDRHGDLTDRLLNRLAARPDVEPERVCLIDLRGTDVVGFSPFICGDAYSKAFYTLSVIKRQALSWGVDLEQTLRCCLLAIAEAGGTLVDIEELLTDAGFRTRLLDRVGDPYVKRFFDRYNALRPEGQRGLTGPVLNKVSGLWAVPRVRQMLGSSEPLPLERLLNTPGQIILVSLAASALHDTAGLIGGMFIGAVTLIALSRIALPEEKRNPISLIVDECEHLLNDAYLVALAEGRKHGLSLTLANQNLSQLPTDLREGILANSGLLVCFQTSAGDAGHLANEMVSAESRHAISKHLVSQPVGTAFFARRGQETVQVKTIHSPDPKSHPARVELIKKTSARAYATTHAKSTARTDAKHEKEEFTDDRRPML